jgi:hypothetical protein
MKRYKVQQIILSEVRVWGYVEADNLHDALNAFTEAGTANFTGFDHEIIADKETLSLSIETVAPRTTTAPFDPNLTEKLVNLIY